ncbi:MAG: gliding motility-associated C-terminal domain-containing protein, partial [Bacteroidetes bacterium]|nr:gliding motility-associated C-terminal domain-containing protein [Bacteroidota bacterium]
SRIAGPGVTILNPDYTGDPFAAGSFKAVNAGLGFDSGIVLCTGAAGDVAGNASFLASTNNNRLGDIQLNTLAHATTHDAAILEFDIVPSSDTLRFEYFFGSEEYINATCGPYNDAFAFFISGPGINGAVNMALVPGTNIPVTVNSINNGIPGPSGNIANCTALGPGSPFTQLYVDNQNGNFLSYQGCTKIMTALHAVTPCDTYHLKIMIADAGNRLYDSGVFLKANSIRTKGYHITARNRNGQTPATIAFGCNDALVTLKRDQREAYGETLYYILGGDAQLGVDYSINQNGITIPAYADSVRFSVYALRPDVGGQKTLKIYLVAPKHCSWQPQIIDSTTIELVNTPELKLLSGDTSICLGDAINLKAEYISGMNYYWQPTSGMTGGNTAHAMAFPKITTKYFVQAIQNNLGCTGLVDSVLVTVLQGPKLDAGLDQSICAGATLMLSGQSQDQVLPDSYSWQGPNNFSDTGAVINISSIAQNQNGHYIVSALGINNHCPGHDTVLVTVRPAPDPPRVFSPLVWCVDGPPTALSAYGTDLRWYSDSGKTSFSGTAQPIPALSQTGVFYYYVTQNLSGCESKTAEIKLNIVSCCAQDLIVPSAFSPNGDGKNDQFRILGGDEGVLVDVRVYNRWGQTVFHGLGREGWNGNFGGKPAALGSYFYVLKVDCRNGKQQIQKGTIDLIR